MWFATAGGVSRFDGESWRSFTASDGLPGDRTQAMMEDEEGHIWVASWGDASRTSHTGSDGGLSRFDGESWTSYTVDDGLPSNLCSAVFKDRGGHIWVGTRGAGVSRFDGQTFQTIDRGNGLGADVVWAIHQDDEGCYWFATNGGVTRYTPPASHSAPTVTIDAVIADRRYEAEPELDLPASTSIVSFEFHGDSEGTDADRLVYRYRLQGHGESWRTTRDRRVELIDVTPETTPSRYRLSTRRWPTPKPPRCASPCAIPCRSGLTSSKRECASAPPSSKRPTNGSSSRTPSNGCALRPSPCGKATTSKKVLTAAFRELRAQDLTIHALSALMYDEEEGVRTNYHAFEAPEQVPAQLPPGFEIVEQGVGVQVDRLLRTEWPASSYERWRKGEIYHEHLDSKQLQAHLLEFRRRAGSKELVPLPDGEAFFYGFPFAQGEFSVASIHALSDAEVDIIRQFAEAATIGYQRYLDFVSLEEANRKIQEATRHKSDFLARMSHDLRTPMNAIIGYTRILLRRTKQILDERQYQNLENIQTSADNLLVLINDVLDLSRIEAGRMDVHPEQVDLEQLIRECARSIEPLLKADVTLELQIDGTTAMHTDPDQLRRVVMNLLGNAVKFTERGTITVALRDIDGKQQLAVADTGVGISAEDLPNIFEEFHQVEGNAAEPREGTGLGLAIAKRTIELLGGEISVESEVGKGTTFTLRLADIEA